LTWQERNIYPVIFGVAKPFNRTDLFHYLNRKPQYEFLTQGNPQIRIFEIRENLTVKKFDFISDFILGFKVRDETSREERMMKQLLPIALFGFFCMGAAGILANSSLKKSEGKVDIKFLKATSCYNYGPR